MNNDHQQGGAWVLTDVTLIIKGSELDPDEVTKELDIQPTAVRPPGPDRWGPPGEVDGQWRLQCNEHSTRILSEQLDTILTAAESRSNKLKAFLLEGFKVTLTIGGYADSDSQIILSPAELSRVARLGIPLILAPSLSER
ncbi:DUF4279 domain-containing protein [Streptomyces lunaelactis]|uniref:DUF4279 domain-containing protein n=1 Tax=Streptomyces lunaelactis TaxID=1535768 RepID=UPI001584BA18|nr:DUF4279 domain-containing protein [Streptomyces lunaelactis]NUK05622.1 DUF4279 domain-containing protein [Streptomyces lunaelactis]NUK20019.1 DUF4279 domain-containing protein [Streptomyces lunaelactis]NUK26076.1 DUF4279 domain-containing protein [Streptomyces lunaelactis]NUK38592.1 DUF4279 domain-containing protein [Streptomyces lunaelactis]NUK45141.1 DUF4279 domain-containing protein [Streptomyces lunaelactis]